MSEQTEQVESSERAAEPFALSPPEGKPKRGRAKASEARGRERRYKQGTSRRQEMLLPARVEDYVDEKNLVRAIDVYVDSLDLVELGFANAGGELGAGRPAYDPGMLLKLYLYGYLNRVRSSRRLQAECRRNLELIWLLRGLRPNYHSIADFRKNNAKALRATCRDFVLLCGELEMIDAQRIGIDGSLINASASDASIKTKKQLESEFAAIERAIERYEQQLDEQDANERGSAASDAVTPEQLEELKARAERKREQIKQLETDGETQLSRTDPDARRMRKNGQKVTGYNLQSVVEDTNKLIITHAVTNAGNDLGQMVPMIEQAQEVLAQIATTAPTPAPGAADAQPQERASTGEHVEAPVEAPVSSSEAPVAPEVLADAGYCTESDIATCQERGIPIYVPIPDKKDRSAKTRGALASSQFHYDRDEDCYHCPGGQRLERRGNPIVRNGVEHQRYRSQAKVCATCELRSQCLSAKGNAREIERSEHADAIERHREHMQGDEAQGKMRQRSGLCEHPFGTLKRWLGWDHFLVRGFEKVRGEMALLINCYNLRRVLNILGIDAFIEICRERREARRAGAKGKDIFPPFFLPLRRSQRLCALFARIRAMCIPSAKAHASAPLALNSAP